MAAACAAVLDDDEPEPLRPQKTCYEVIGVTLSVDGFAYRQDPRGGNLSAHGKATGEAFWPASRLLMDHLVRDCELLKGDAPRRVVELDRREQREDRGRLDRSETHVEVLEGAERP